MTLDLMGGRRLLLVGSRLGWIWILALAIAIVLLIVLYREERRLVTRRAGLFLLSLRLLVAAALVLALFEPIAERTFHETLKGRVIVAVDVSESMTTADPARPAESTAKLAKVLGLSAVDTVAGLPRREVARRLIDGPGSVLARLEAEHVVETFTFARRTEPASPKAVADSLKAPNRPGDPALSETNWDQALERALESGSKAAPCIGVVLLSDGQRNSPADPMPTVDRLAAQGVPVYSVLIGSTAPPRDAAIAAVKSPESVYRGDVATVVATIKVDGYAGKDVAVTLERAGGSPLRQTVRAPASASGARPVVSFSVPLEDAGTSLLSIAVEPLAGDVRRDNDRRTIAIQVADDKARVLLVDGEARWEFRYIRNAFERDTRVALKSVVFHQPPASGALSRSYEIDVPPKPDVSRNQPDPLGEFDAIILGDVGSAEVSSELWARLEAFVAERGGTLIFSVGPRSWAALAHQETARKLLPVTELHVVASGDEQGGARSGADDNLDQRALPRGASIRPLAVGVEASAWPMLQLDGDPDRNRATWAKLPRMPWLIAGRAKPGARALAVAGEDDTAAVIAAQPYGLGKVLWLGTDGTWRWRFRTGDRYHHRFWGQVARWAAGARLAAGNAHVRFGAAKARYPEGERIELQARISEGEQGVGPELLVAGKIFKADAKTGAAAGEPIAIVPLRAVAGQPRAFGGDAVAAAAGRYVMRLDVPQLAEKLGLGSEGGAADFKIPEAVFDVVSRESSETVELAAARDQVDQLAAATGGRVLADHEALELPSLLHARTRQTTRVVETTLWDQPAYLLIFLGLLTVEWVSRKRLGLP